MSSPATAFRRSQLVVLALLLCAIRLPGQAVDSPIVFSNQDAITTSLVTPVPLGGINSNTNADANQWLKIEFHYSVTPKTGNFLDAAEFKIWIEGRDLYAADATSKDGVAVGLTGTVDYVNLPASKDVYGVFYVHPNTLARYATETGANDFLRKFDIHLEAYVNGKKMDNIDKNKESDPLWYQKLRALPGLVYRHNQSPFLLADLGRYPAIALPSGSDSGDSNGGDAASGPVTEPAPAAPSAPPAP